MRFKVSKVPRFRNVRLSVHCQCNSLESAKTYSAIITRNSGGRSVRVAPVLRIVSPAPCSFALVPETLFLLGSPVESGSRALSIEAMKMIWVSPMLADSLWLSSKRVPEWAGVTIMKTYALAEQKSVLVVES